MKWTLFTVLFLFAPALLFMVMAVMFMPAIFFAAGIFAMIPKVAVPAHTSETLVFIGFFGVHLLVYVGLYWLISMVLAKILSLIRNPVARNVAFAAVCLGVASVGLFPVGERRLRSFLGRHGLWSLFPRPRRRAHPPQTPPAGKDRAIDEDIVRAAAEASLFPGGRPGARMTVNVVLECRGH
jgi:hypothetical protein